jgi:hypothetical protein
MERFDIQFRAGRTVPGPQGRYFLLWPPKAGYFDARQFAQDALVSAPANALLLADPILAAPVEYLQAVEGWRPDIVVRFCCWSIDDELRANLGRPIALADVDPSIYPMERLREDYNIAPSGPIFVLSARGVQ